MEDMHVCMYICMWEKKKRLLLIIPHLTMAAISKQLSIYACKHSVSMFVIYIWIMHIPCCPLLCCWSIMSSILKLKILSQAELIDVHEVVEDRAVTFELIELVEFDGCKMTGYPPRLLTKEEERVEERGDFSIIAWSCCCCCWWWWNIMSWFCSFMAVAFEGNRLEDEEEDDIIAALAAACWCSSAWPVLSCWSNSVQSMPWPGGNPS